MRQFGYCDKLQSKVVKRQVRWEMMHACRSWAFQADTLCRKLWFSVEVFTTYFVDEIILTGLTYAKLVTMENSHSLCKSRV